MNEVSQTREYLEFARRVRLEQVLTESCSARRLAAEASTDAEMRLEIGVAPTPEAIFYRLEVQAILKSENGKEVGRVEVSVVTRYDITEGDLPTENIIQEFADREAATVAYPYAREGVQSLAARIGFAGVLLPLLGPTSTLDDIPHDSN
ncbi:hypothetical protein [Streptomyces asiaticus]|uniref:hypothetical protein n=1 Tax=Streptomyces asiaticus TaxID=114695 RepID=UPI003D74CF18